MLLKGLCKDLSTEPCRILTLISTTYTGFQCQLHALNIQYIKSLSLVIYICHCDSIIRNKTFISLMEISNMCSNIADTAQKQLSHSFRLIQSQHSRINSLAWTFCSYPMQSMLFLWANCSITPKPMFARHIFNASPERQIFADFLQCRTS